MSEKCRILLVDDERGIAEGLSILLSAMGRPWEIVGIAEDGEQGIAMVDRLRPDIVITDVRMPVMDGLEMIRSLREAGSRCRFIILSGYADFSYAKQAMKLGVRAYVTKPVDEDELAASIAELWQEKRASAAPDIPEKPPQKREPFDDIRDYVAAHFEREMTLQELSARFFLNPYYIGQLFRKKTGMTFQSFVTQLRVDRAKQYLRGTNLMVYEISERVGYSDTVYFSRVFERLTGLRPTDYRKQQENGGTNHEPENR